MNPIISVSNFRSGFYDEVYLCPVLYCLDYIERDGYRAYETHPILLPNNDVSCLMTTWCHVTMISLINLSIISLQIYSLLSVAHIKTRPIHHFFCVRSFTIMFLWAGFYILNFKIVFSYVVTHIYIYCLFLIIFCCVNLRKDGSHFALGMCKLNFSF